MFEREITERYLFPVYDASISAYEARGVVLVVLFIVAPSDVLEEFDGTVGVLVEVTVGILAKYGSAIKILFTQGNIFLPVFVV